MITKESRKELGRIKTKVINLFRQAKEQEIAGDCHHQPGEGDEGKKKFKI